MDVGILTRFVRHVLVTLFAAMRSGSTPLHDKPGPLEEQYIEFFKIAVEAALPIVGRAAAEDVASEAIHALGECVARGDTIKSVKGMLKSIARNRAIDIARHNRRVDQGASADRIASGGFDEVDENEIVTQAMARLSPRQRECVNLRIDGWPVSRIATHLGVERRTVTTHLTRAAEKLLDLLQIDPDMQRR